MLSVCSALATVGRFGATIAKKIAMVVLKAVLKANRTGNTFALSSVSKRYSTAAWTPMWLDLVCRLGKDKLTVDLEQA